MIDLKNTIPFIDLKAQYSALKTEINTRIQNVLEHGQYIMGPEVAELEVKLAEFTGSKYCITCASGTEALLMSLMALDIGPGDEVITTPFTFAATAETIVLLGATPVFVDIDSKTCLLNPNLIEAKINERTKAIMPVSLYGQVCDMDEINSIAARHGNIPVIEDAAQSFGASYKIKKSCNLSTIGCTSFFPSKPLGCYGDGGAIFTNDETLATALREIRVHGQKQRYFHTRVGVGGRMDTLQCAIVLAKLTRFDWEIKQRHLLANEYYKQLSEMAPNVELLEVAGDRDCVWAQYTVFSDNRAKLQEHLKQEGIPTAIHYPIPLNQQPAYASFCCIDCTPVSNSMAKRVVSLPMSPDLSMENLSKVVLSVANSAANN